MPELILRESRSASASLTTAASGSPISMQWCAYGTIQIPTGSPITLLTYYAVAGDGTTCIPLYDSSGSAVTQTVVAGRAYPLPNAIAGCKQIYIQANAVGSVYIEFKG